MQKGILAVALLLVGGACGGGGSSSSASVNGTIGRQSMGAQDAVSNVITSGSDAEALNSVMEYERFEGEQYLSGGEDVAAIVQAAGHAKLTGRPFESAIVRVYTFSGGKIVRVRNYYDTAAYVDALRTGP